MPSWFDVYIFLFVFTCAAWYLFAWSDFLKYLLLTVNRLFKKGIVHVLLVALRSKATIGGFTWLTFQNIRIVHSDATVVVKHVRISPNLFRFFLSSGNTPFVSISISGVKAAVSSSVQPPNTKNLSTLFSPGGSTKPAGRAVLAFRRALNSCLNKLHVEVMLSDIQVQFVTVRSIIKLYSAIQPTALPIVVTVGNISCLARAYAAVQSAPSLRALALTASVDSISVTIIDNLGTGLTV